MGRETETQLGIQRNETEATRRVIQERIAASHPIADARLQRRLAKAARDRESAGEDEAG